MKNGLNPSAFSCAFLWRAVLSFPRSSRFRSVVGLREQVDLSQHLLVVEDDADVDRVEGIQRVVFLDDLRARARPVHQLDQPPLEVVEDVVLQRLGVLDPPARFAHLDLAPDDRVGAQCRALLGAAVPLGDGLRRLGGGRDEAAPGGSGAHGRIGQSFP